MSTNFSDLKFVGGQITGAEYMRQMKGKGLVSYKQRTVELLEKGKKISGAVLCVSIIVALAALTSSFVIGNPLSAKISATILGGAFSLSLFGAGGRVLFPIAKKREEEELLTRGEVYKDLKVSGLLSKGQTITNVFAKEVIDELDKS